MDTITVSAEGLLCFQEGTMKRGPLKMPIWSLQGVAKWPCSLFVLLAGGVYFRDPFRRLEVRQLCQPLEAFLI
jgi:hypothetical protein